VNIVPLLDASEPALGSIYGESVMRLVLRTGALQRRRAHVRDSIGDRWFVDETYVKITGVWRYVYRAIDQHGQVIDVLVSIRRDAVAARRFFSQALRTLKVIPREVVSDAAWSTSAYWSNWFARRGTTSSSTRTIRSRSITANSSTG
jgi:transposase-like protein